MSGAVSDVGSTLTKFDPVRAIVDGLARNAPGFIKDDELGGQILKQTSNTINAPNTAFNAMKDGKTPTQALKTALGPVVQNSKETVGTVKGFFSEEEAAPLSIVAEDPAAVAEDAAKKKAQAKRKAEVDIMTGQPGRGGTILTDQYTYNV